MFPFCQCLKEGVLTVTSNTITFMFEQLTVYDEASLVQLYLLCFCLKIIQ